MIRNVHIWLPSYIARAIKGLFRLSPHGPIHIIFCLVDHFEPKWNRPPYEVQRRRVDVWVEGYPKIAGKHSDSNGYHPRHTWFYPIEEYEPEFLDKLSKLCKDGYGEIEIHLHHDNDTPEGLKGKLEEGKRLFSEHGVLGRYENKVVYAFIHGNWALDNSRKDGRWCGVNNELQILRETGCYADFTLPSAPSDTQTRKINSIYYAVDDPLKPKSHNTGIDVRVRRGIKPSIDPLIGDLMIIQGPLCLDWRARKKRFLPGIENGSISSDRPVTPRRVDLWVRQHIHVKGRPDWIFVVFVNRKGAHLTIEKGPTSGTLSEL
ncbi:MAG: hypothetical protein DRP09_13355 [Candidatus Thorarchaeota archaeon]|nr:MAG: hypothetical protein DRP09_13355 [Candidatus Thorarchaeota archaeon]